jgi:hypothetical protein
LIGVGLLRAIRFYRPGFRAATVFAFLVLVGACKKNAATSPPPTAQAELPLREVSKDSELLFTYVEPSGMCTTTDKADKVPEVARRVVRVMGQAKGAARMNAALAPMKAPGPRRIPGLVAAAN